jgi:leader peptidase (prepilin peptidase) / N-methyltransferase
MVILILIVLGLCLGSFVNAFVWRHWKREFADRDAGPSNPKAAAASKSAKAKQPSARDLSIVHGRSMCTHCHHELAAKDLIPVVSYLMLRGRCRYCGKPIQDSPLAELLTPLLFVVSYVFWPESFSGAGLVTFIFWLAFIVGFVALFVYDLRWQLLPYSIVFPMIALAIVQVIVVAIAYEGPRSVIGPLWGAAIIGGMFFLLYAVSKGRWIGDGDIPLGILLGLLAGGPANAFLVIFIASLIGTLVAVPLLMTGRADRSSHLPFGPFLIAGAVVVVLFGATIISWYLEDLVHV